jgi:hypothetical protein
MVNPDQEQGLGFPGKTYCFGHPTGADLRNERVFQEKRALDESGGGGWRSKTASLRGEPQLAMVNTPANGAEDERNEAIGVKSRAETKGNQRQLTAK